MSDWVKPFSSRVPIVSARVEGWGEWASLSRMKLECKIKSFIFITDDIFF